MLSELSPGSGSFMRGLPENFSVVSDLEFSTLKYLPDFELNGECLRRVDDAEERFILPQSVFDRWRAITEEIEVDDNTPIVIEQHVTPTPVPPDPLAAEKLALLAYGLGENQPLPNYSESSRPRDHRGGGLDIGALFGG
jgi:hypothetical protein